jgi:hypothetical protein
MAPIEPVVRARIKFFGRYKRGAIRDGVLLSIESTSAWQPRGWSCDSDAVVAAFDADVSALDGNSPWNRTLEEHRSARPPWRRARGRSSSRRSAGSPRIKLAIPPGGFGQQLDLMQRWLDENAGADGWAMAPAGCAAVLLSQCCRTSASSVSAA